MSENVTDLEGERRHEREETGIFLLRLTEQNADSEVHKRLGEIDHLLADETDRQCCYRQVRSLNPYVSTSLKNALVLRLAFHRGTWLN